ncbi:MAG: dihydropteroate synthase [Armatimonadetes bacterium]|nr:dihydropteroate synthase [Armatimonadota bacterium]
MGVLNVTPDSFSDGGQFLGAQQAVEHGQRMADEGADLIDVGGESTQPGAEPVPEEEELRRVLPVVEQLAADGLALSIDTSKPAVARECLLAGASVVNDVTALRSSEMAAVCADAGCTVCLMHMLGDPRTMQSAPRYKDVVDDVADALTEAIARAEQAGVDPDRIWIDPGIGFGKTLRHNLELLNRLEEIVAIGYPVLIGVSRKSFIGRLLGSAADPAPVGERLEGSLAAQVLAVANGARILRVHDVAESVRANVIAEAVLSQSRASSTPRLLQE